METKEIYDRLSQSLVLSNIYMQEPMSKHTTFKVGGNADIYIKAKSVKEIETILAFAKENNISLTVIGNGSNILVKDKGIRGIVIQVLLNNYSIKKEEKNAIITARFRSETYRTCKQAL